MREREPELINKTRVVYRSEQLGFPPIVGLKSASDTALAQSISAAFIGMSADPLGRNILSILELDGFTRASADLYRSTLEKWLVVKAQA
jgi:phosphonate transport system substrate-binding protein